MITDKPSSYRKVVHSWYDSNPTCWTILVVMLLIFFFGMIGISVAFETEVFQQHLWAPLLIMALSSLVIIMLTVRLIIRYISRHSK
ncbi:MAG: hypothetical protein K9L30_01730 [Desulfobacterales bacterium]|nr:hypothetical protein [Desulfobacterales bacterium]